MRRKNHTLFSAVTALVLTLGSGCSGDLSDELPNDETPIGASGHVTSTQESGGTIVTQINAADTKSWVYFQFAGGKEVNPQDPQTSTEWDIATQRYNIKLNGGVSGGGGGTASLITGMAFDAVTQAPAGGYVTDQPDSTDDDMDPDYAITQLGPWYDYNVMTHVLTPKDQVYVVRTPGGAYYKLQMTGYYDQAGSSGYPAFRWKAVSAPLLTR